MMCTNRITDNGGYKWIPSTVYAGLPPLALSVGHEPDGRPIYVGRTVHNGSTYPVKIVPEKQSACIECNGAIVFKQDFEILCGSGFCWTRSGKGHIPSNAVSCQKSGNNSPQYIGRAHHGDGLIPGRIDPTKGCLFIPAEEGETSYLFYDVLVHDQANIEVNDRGQWVPAVSSGPVPPGAVRAGHDSDGTLIYVGRVNHLGNMIPAKIIPEKNMAHTQHEGKEIGKQEYEALCNAQVAWIPFSGKIPQNAVSCGRMVNGEQVFIGRGRYWDDSVISKPDPKKKSTWITGKNNQSPPEGAVLAGFDSDQSPIYVGRVMYEGHQLPAKVIPRKQLCHSQYNGEELEMSSYEGLCHGNVSWVKFRGTIPPNALECGRLRTGEAVFIGRGRYLGSLTPGRVLSSEKVLYIPFGWKEIKITDFEILVDNDFKATNKKLNWIHTKREQPAPPGTIQAGNDSDGSPIYVGRVQHDGNRFVGKVIPEKQICDTTDENGHVIPKLSYEALLCDGQVSWVKFPGAIPTEAVECGRDRHGGKVFVGRCRHGSELVPGTVLEAEKKLRFVVGTEMKMATEFEILVHGSNDRKN